MSVWKRAGVALGAAGGVAGAALAANRVAASRLRRGTDHTTDGAVDDLAIHADRTWRLAGHDGGEVFVVEAGSGPPILLSHGVTLSVRTWAKQLDHLPREGFRVIAFDHRGHGESTLGTTGHGIEQLAHDIRTVLEGLDLHDVVIVGHSMGGVAAQAFCLHHPDIARARVAGVVLLSSLARSPLGANPRVARFMTQVMHRLPDGTAALRARDLGLIISRVGFGRDPVPAHMEAARQMMLATSAATRRDAVATLFGLDLTPRLGEIDRPTLVIGGTADLIAPIAESRRLARGIRGARLEEVPGAGHMVMLERTELLESPHCRLRSGSAGRTSWFDGFTRYEALTTL
jgi:non-heme chloroperoxidase